MRRAITLFILLLAQPSVAVPQAQVVDRIAVRIEDDILTLSEVRELGRFLQLVNGPAASGRSEMPSEAELIGRLIDQWIVNAEATAVRFPRPAKDDVQRGVEQLAAQFASAEAFRQRLKELELTPESAARHVERQIYLPRYLDYKFRPAAQVENAQVEKYYREELLPELRRRGQEAPAMENVEEQIRELLTQREISTRAARWLEETRARLKIEILGKKSTP